MQKERRRQIVPRVFHQRDSNLGTLDGARLKAASMTEDRFFHGYYDSYCYYYLPLYVFCGEQMLAVAMT